MTCRALGVCNFSGGAMNMHLQTLHRVHNFYVSIAKYLSSIRSMESYLRRSRYGS